MPILGRKLAILATFLRYMDFKFVLYIVYIDITWGKPSWKSFWPKLTILASKKHKNGHISKPHFAQVSITKKPIYIDSESFRQMENCRRRRLFGEWHFGKMDFEIWPFCGFFEAKVVNLGPIDFQLGLPLNINRNDGQNKFEVHISKKGQKWLFLANIRPGRHFWRSTTPKWLARETNQMPLEAKLYLNFLDFGFLFLFLLQGLTWAALGLWTQNHPQVVGSCSSHGFRPIAQNILCKWIDPLGTKKS